MAAKLKKRAFADYHTNTSQYSPDNNDESGNAFYREFCKSLLAPPIRYEALKFSGLNEFKHDFFNR